MKAAMGDEARAWLLAVVALLLAVAVAVAEESTSITMPGCQDKCGNVSIPYPFGTTEGCYFNDDFYMNCNSTHYDPPRAFLRRSNIEVINITVQGKLRIMQFIARDCYNRSGAPVSSNNPFLRLSKFSISDTDNVFVAIGCDTEATIQGIQRSNGYNYTSGCISKCDSIDYVDNHTCSGIGCCQTSIAKGVRYFDVSVGSYNNHRAVWNFNPCSYAFVIEEKMFNFSSNHLRDLQNVTKMPMVLDWLIGNETCEKVKANAMHDACQGDSTCYDVDNGSGYRCKCLDGYEGNPYLPNGCQDIDECKDPTLNKCERVCRNTKGNYTCFCPKGYHGDGRTDGTGCVASRSLVIELTVGLGVGITALIAGSTWSYWAFKSWKLIKLKHKFFQQNGGFMLQQELSRRDTSTETAKIFSADELEKATNNYDESRIIGRGGYGTVYKGTLSDGRIIAIKKSQIVDESQIDQFINEVVVLSQINHRNVHIHNKSKASSLTFETRLRIAAETAGEKALSFQRSEEKRNLAMYFLSALKQDRLSIILDDCVVKEAKIDQVKEVAKLAKRCLRVKGEERPTMKEVAMELEGMRMMGKHHPWVNNDEPNLEEMEYLLGEPSLKLGSDGATSNAAYDSMKDLVVLQAGNGR
ncbi:hypothetical protein V6N11_056833 [Hibiscus sabdariffa]|uniref:Uncharacterized protein n=1 Tax=Hibiscus sabdariffa TaxID=183260 RepID=A0ABR2T5Y6_9ROSI